ncbi:uncharacterized protein PAC_14614 [Phialocephala subalpina]|uniref:DUF6594 domain-containing protein n=1 Tax=Phialocephala subalpina TaxID=576137 RepID=A0A1L7XI47_9HELO|nr:uncharacterized protein PAC_14614 [Phialocephala subalpina]
MASDSVFRIFRRFDFLTVRTLLYLQDELCELEDRLNALDDSDLQSGNHAHTVSLHSRRHDQNQQQKALPAEIQVKLKTYHGAFNEYAEVASLRKPQKLYLDSVRNWLDGRKPTRRKARSRDTSVQYYSRSTIRRLVRTILTMLAVVLLFVPVIVLYYMHRPSAKLAVIAIFLFCFALPLALWTKSGNHEIFTALATYAMSPYHHILGYLG